MHVAKNPTMEAIVCENRSETWEQMWERTNRLGHALHNLGIQKSDRVGVMLENCVEFVESFVALMKLGVIITPINIHLGTEELAYQLNHAEVRCVITNSNHAEKLMMIRMQVPSVSFIMIVGTEKLDHTLLYEDLIDQADSNELETLVFPEDIHMIMYTSGTTGRPKGAIRGYDENYHTGIAAAIEWGLHVGDRYLAVTPLYHAASCAWLLTTFITGGTVIILPKFTPTDFLEAIASRDVTWSMMVPVMYDRLLMLTDEELLRYQLKNLRLFVSGGAPLHTITKIKLKKWLPAISLYEFYGSTELGISTVLRDEDQLRKERCVGKALQDVELRLLDPSGNQIQNGELGILYSRGLCGFRGYWRDDQATKDAFTDEEWATVGDIARQDNEGYFYIVDRAKDLVITGV